MPAHPAVTQLLLLKTIASDPQQDQVASFPAAVLASPPAAAVDNAAPLQAQTRR
jgi:hypothetical protein